ncbi:MAG: hypothetical protein HYS74_02065 [Parcubacteria group bacterium]|nr:hypothetical protein [Parcubacteria group bacterium]
MPVKPFDPNYLNIEFFFNLIFLWFSWFTQKLQELVGLAGTADLAAVKWFLWAFSAACAAGIVYTLVQHGRLQRAQEKKYGELRVTAIEKLSLEDRNKRWQHVLDYMDSPNESDWRLAIIEADSMLENILDKMGYIGATIGDRLKGIEQSDFLTLNEAWEAHKVRNRIAHEGTAFRLTKREADRVINLFRKVFEEFHYI